MSPVFNAEVFVMPKAEVADPQGQAIENALDRLQIEGAEGVSAHHVRVGKVFHLDLEAPDKTAAERALTALADKVLHNPNIETFECDVKGA